MVLKGGFGAFQGVLRIFWRFKMYQLAYKLFSEVKLSSPGILGRFRWLERLIGDLEDFWCV